MFSVEHLGQVIGSFVVIAKHPRLATPPERFPMRRGQGSSTPLVTARRSKMASWRRQLASSEQLTGLAEVGQAFYLADVACAASEPTPYLVMAFAISAQGQDPGFSCEN